MKSDNKLTNQDRREFIFKAFSSCALCCLAVPNLIASKNESDSIDCDDKHKFLNDSGMSMQAVYDFAFKAWSIPAMKNLKDQIGHDRFLEMLKESSEKLYETSDGEDINNTERTLKVFANDIKKGCENWSDRLTFKILKENDNEFEMQFTECLWAKTFREANASEIGYAGICFQDYGMTKAFNPKLELIREKTLMEGHDCCHFKWIMKG